MAPRAPSRRRSHAGRTLPAPLFPGTPRFETLSSPATLALEDGSVFRGRSCGAPGESGGELVFNTSMTGYQEVLTDPSYKGQVVVMTAPHVGNYGIVPSDHESAGTWLEGFVVREMCRTPSNWEATESLPDFLLRSGVCAIEGVDTRALTLTLRRKGALRGVLSTRTSDAAALIRRAKALPSMAGRALAGKVASKASYRFDQPLPDGGVGRMAFRRAPRVVVLDFGVKRGILRSLVSLGCAVTVVGAGTTAETVSALRPDGVLLSNGPGDPEPLTGDIETIRRLLRLRLPLFGICLGHQLLGLALGGRTYKLKFGHHGANHPVKDLTTGKVEVTTQNHGFCVDPSSLPREARVTHLNLNDGTCEGLAHSRLPAFSVQYHPEACAGPHDARYLFGRFGALLARRLARSPAEAR